MTAVAGTFELASSNLYQFQNTLSNDVLIYTTSPHQRILLGTQSNVLSAMEVEGSNIRISVPLKGMTNSSIQIENATISNDTLFVNNIRHVVGTQLLDIDGMQVNNGLVRLAELEVGYGIYPNNSSETLWLDGIAISNTTLYVNRIQPAVNSSDVLITGISMSNSTLHASNVNSETVNTTVLSACNIVGNTINTQHFHSISEDSTLQFLQGISMSNYVITASNIRVQNIIGTPIIQDAVFEGVITASNITGTASNLRFTTAILPSSDNITIGTPEQRFKSLYLEHDGIHLSNVHIFQNSNTKYLEFQNDLCDAPMVLRAKAVQYGDDDGEQLLLRVRNGYLETISESTGQPTPIIKNLYSCCNNIGIGIPHPSQALEVNGSILATGDIRALGFMHVPGISNNIQGDRLFSSSSNGTSGFIFSNGSNQSQIMHIVPRGNSGWVGINRAPTSALEVQGDVRLHGDLFVNGELIRSASAISGVRPVEDGLKFTIYDRSHSFQFMHSNDLLVQIKGDGALKVGNTVIDNSNQQGLTMRLDNSNNSLASLALGAIILNHGEGVTTYSSTIQNISIPVSQLVTTSDSLTVNLERAGHQFRVQYDNQDLFKVNGTGATYVRTLSGNSANIPVYATPNGMLTPSVSDARLKTNIQPLTYGLEEVMKLKPVHYTWTEEAIPVYGSQHEIGLLAQQVGQVVPEVVGSALNSNMYVDYARLVPVLLRSVQELNEKVKNLEERLN